MEFERSDLRGGHNIPILWMSAGPGCTTMLVCVRSAALFLIPLALNNARELLRKMSALVCIYNRATMGCDFTGISTNQRGIMMTKILTTKIWVKGLYTNTCNIRAIVSPMIRLSWVHQIILMPPGILFTNKMSCEKFNLQLFSISAI